MLQQISKHLDFTDKSLKNPLDGEGLERHFQIQVSRKGIFNAFVGSFSARLYDGVFLNTMPGAPETHWKQSLFFIETPLTVEKDYIGKEQCMLQKMKTTLGTQMSEQHT